jgi:3-oxoacyl-[acyl-carrier protein] reductase
VTRPAGAARAGRRRREAGVKDLEGRVAVVTGGAGGVGRGIADVLAAEGARVAVVDRDAAAGRAAADALRAAGGEALAVAADVADRRQVEAMAAEVDGRFGRIDIVAANAGVYPSVPLEAMDDDAWDAVMDVNVKGALHTVQACLPAMRRGGYGRVVFTSSITGSLVGAPGLAHYAASKAALLGLMRSVALEVVDAGITVNAVLPGNIRTPGLDGFDPGFVAGMVRSIPMKRLGEPREVGWAVRFLASEEAGYITGQTLVVDGGQVLPEGAPYL